MISTLERIADHANNLAEAVTGASMATGSCPVKPKTKAQGELKTRLSWAFISHRLTRADDFHLEVIHITSTGTWLCEP